MGINQYIKIGSKIKQARISKGIRQKEMAVKLGLSVSTYSNYENNYREPKLDIVEKICCILDMTIDELMSYPISDTESCTTSPLSYEQSYSYASSEEDFNKLQEERQIEPEKKKVRRLTAPLSQDNKDNGIYIDPNLQKLYEAAIEKAIRHEELTEEEQQIIIGIPGQLRQKSDSYEDSHSFASSEEELNRILKQRQKQGEELLLNDYRKLSEIGQLEARKRVSELTEIPRYTKTDEPPQD